MELIKDKVAIVTGAAAGIGAGVAKLFAENGAHVFLADLDGAQVKKVAADLKAKGGSAFGFEANAGRRRTIDADVDATMTRLYETAGIHLPDGELSVEAIRDNWDRITDTAGQRPHGQQHWCGRHERSPNGARR